MTRPSSRRIDEAALVGEDRGARGELAISPGPHGAERLTVTLVP
jgi:hypothetical protein